MNNVDFSRETLLQAALDTLAEHVAVIDTNGTILMINEAWRRFGCKSGGNEANIGVSANYFEVCRNATGQARREAYATLRGLEAVANGTLREFSLEYACQTPTETLWFNVSGKPLRTPGVGIIVSHADVSQQKRYRAMAYTDPLTGLSNRRSFTDFADQTLTRAECEDQVVALVVADLNGFKKVNDAYGHEAGDELLKAFSGRLRAAFREGDFVARLGGDELAVVLPVLSEAALGAALERCLAHLNEPYMFGQQAHVLSASLGVALFPFHGHEQDTLIRSADRALYTSKRCGGGVSFYAHPQSFFSPKTERVS